MRGVVFVLVAAVGVLLAVGWSGCRPGRWTGWLAAVPHGRIVALLALAVAAALFGIRLLCRPPSEMDTAARSAAGSVSGDG